MKRFFKPNYILLIFFIAGVFLSSCKKDEEIIPSPDVSEINQFIWENMSEAYLWNDLIPQDIDLNSEFDPEALFEKLLNRPTDRWSYITDDYDGLINNFKGIEKSFGHYFKLFLLPASNNVIAVIEYVVPGSPAARAGIRRGNKFFKVNGTTINTDNYMELLFDRDMYTLSFGDINERGLISFTADKTLNAEIIAENPVYLHKTLDVDETKIGYLVYNQFIQDYDDSLVSVFNTFKQDNVSELVLDLRYNPGGSISSAILLGSMIAPAAATENNEIFSKMIWNENITNEFLAEGGPDSDFFVERFLTPEVNLNLSRVYILVSGNTASASELVINCLAPYMEVVLIGPENTVGKFVGSVTIYDEETSHGWAMQPIVLKTANASGYTDFFDGFSPDYLIPDDFFAPLGALEEEMLAKSVELITGIILTEPARLSSSSLPENLIPLTNPQTEQKQKMFFDLK